MANIRKTFNFRNGVQVDDDNLIVNPNGLVGIGTSVPTELLDVRGTAKVVGLVTATEVFATNIRSSGVSTFSGGIRAGIVSVSQSGIITATSGVVTYYGDGGRLLNLPTSQWLDVDIGLGFTSIYAQGFVGVSTISPIYPFQVGGTDATRVFNGSTVFGVGIDSTGNIYSTGIVTAKSYNGIGIGLTDLNASNIAYGTLNNARLPQNINISGILTATSVYSSNVNIDLGGINVIGIVTSSGGFVGNVTGNLLGDVTGTASTARSLTGSPNIIVGIVTATSIGSNISSTGISTVTDRLFVQNSIGVNTASPNAEVHIVKNGVGGVLLTSTQESYVGVARTLTRGQQGGELRFGNLADTFSGQKTLDIVNYDNGNINHYIHRGAAGLGTGNFNWVYGQDQSVKMTLTYDGKLGIAKTNPEREFHVVGTSTISQDLYVGNKLYVRGDSNLSGDLFVNGNFTTQTLTVANGISANLNNTSGVSTFYDIDVNNFAKFAQIGIGTDTTSFPFQMGTDQDLFDGSGLILSSTFIGIGSTASYPFIEINALGKRAILSSVGIGTTRPKAAVDFSEAGVGYFQDAYRFMILPRLNTTERNNLDTATDNIKGAVVFNTSTNVPEYYTGSAWVQMAQSGSISYANRAGIATYANFTGFSTDASNVIGGIVTCAQLQVSNSGIATFTGITTVTGPTFFAKQINVSGVVTASQFTKSGGTSSQFLKADGSVDSSTYLTSYTETDTLTTVTNRGNSTSNGISVGVVTASQFTKSGGTSSQFLKADGSVDSSTYLTSYTETDTLTTVTNRGNTTTNGISVGVVTATQLKVGTGVTVSAGIVTATNGFLSGIGTAVQITTVGNQLVFTVPGVGSTSFTLF